MIMKRRLPKCLKFDIRSAWSLLRRVKRWATLCRAAPRLEYPGPGTALSGLSPLAQPVHAIVLCRMARRNRSNNFQRIILRSADLFRDFRLFLPMYSNINDSVHCTTCTITIVSITQKYLCHLRINSQTTPTQSLLTFALPQANIHEAHQLQTIGSLIRHVSKPKV